MLLQIIRAEVPLRRKLVRLATWLTLGRSRAHYQTWTPHLTIHPLSTQHPSVTYRKRLVCRLFGLEVIDASGQDIYLIGSGPSIGSQDIRRVPPKSAILLNGSITLI